MRSFKRHIVIVLAHILIFSLLTVISQVGGIIYLICLPLYPLIEGRFDKLRNRRHYRFFFFSGVYLVVALVVIPLIAPLFGRVALPVFSSPLKPLTIGTVLLNRHYVKPQLLKIVDSTAKELHEKYPGTITYYLDANFPFFNGFPLFPHLSHNDGKKLDLAFYYQSRENSEYTVRHPSPIGYGVFTGPLEGEPDQPQVCSDRGFWQYGMLESIVPQWSKHKYLLDSARTKNMINLITSKSAIEKVFIEPHLKLRMGLSSPKVRFHGCPAVRHDDHLHIQIK